MVSPIMDNKIKLSFHDHSTRLFSIEQPNSELQNVLFRAYGMGHEYTKPDYYLDRNLSTIYMINYVLNGEGRFIFEGKTYELKPGTLTFAYLGSRSILYPISEDFEFYFFHLQDGPILPLYKAITEQQGNVYHNYPKESVELLWEKLKKLMQEDFNPFEMHDFINSFLTKILQHCSRSNHNKNSVNPLIIRARDLTLKGYDRVQEIANELNINATYLNHIYKQYYGKSLRETIMEEKLNQAKNFLLTTNLSVYEIAMALGYADSNGLICLFKKFLNCTPLEYRKRQGMISSPTK